METIIDADGHLLEPRSIWEEYTEPAYRQPMIQIAKDREGLVAAFFYPTLWLTYGDLTDPEVAEAAWPAYNDWLGDWLARIDSHFDTMGHYVPRIKKRPGEHFCEQCFISMDPDESTLSRIADMGLEEWVIWGSDYPHFDCIFAAVVDQVKEDYAKLPTLVQERIIGENTDRLYDL